MPRRKKPGARKLTKKQYLIAIFKVSKTTYETAPVAIIIQVIGAIITSVLPIVTTYFAALTTTALAEAYAGDETAGERAIWFVVITALLGIVVIGWQSLESYVTQLMRFKVEAAMTDRMYDHFINLDFWRYDDKDTADMYDKALRFGQMFPYVFDRLTQILTALMSVILSVGALLFVNAWLSLIVFVAIVPSVWVQFMVSRAYARHWNENVETRRARAMIEWDMFRPQYIAELRLYSMAKHLMALRSKLRDKDDRQRVEFERKYIPKRLYVSIFQSAGEVIALLWITVQIIHRAQPIGQFLYVQQIVSRAMSSAEQFVRELSGIDEDLANLFDYQEFISLPQAQRKGKRLIEIPDAIKFEHVSFQYPTRDKLVLDDINIKIERGQHVAIVGENGAGKSTLIKLLTGLYNPTDGVILLDNHDLKEVAIDSWHKQLGVLQQNFISYGFATAKSNILFGEVERAFEQERFDQAIDRAEARKFLEKLPKGVDSYVNQWMESDDGVAGTDLSGGQWQRLALARNFYRNSPVVILDEPTSAIDALAETRIFKRLFEDTHRTIITISHRFTTVEKADMIYMLEDGKVVEQGKAKELIAAKGAFYHMFESQLHSHTK
ncbi:MAG: ABC transporter ATP-binding protein [Candidatus Saccharimonadales bacterium]